MSDEVRKAGEKVARRLLGDDYYDRTRTDAAPTYRRRLLRLADEVIFGQSYTRPGLPLETRSLCTIAALTVMGKAEQLRPHINGALNIGIAPEAIYEVIMQMSFYAGFPAALNAAVIADELIPGDKE